MEFKSKIIDLFRDSKRRIQCQPNPQVFKFLEYSGKIDHDPNFEVNRDYQKRDRLLDIRVNWLKEAEDNGGIEEFEGMNVKTLEELLLNGFILPWHCQNASPTVAEIFRFMAKYPQILASGYAVSPFREDYRVAIDGIYVDQDDVSSQLREDFIDFCKSASELLTNDNLYSWWD
jgi:hypothetical protein